VENWRKDSEKGKETGAGKTEPSTIFPPQIQLRTTLDQIRNLKLSQPQGKGISFAPHPRKTAQDYHEYF
jgi:hypothetical protein